MTTSACALFWVRRIEPTPVAGCPVVEKYQRRAPQPSAWLEANLPDAVGANCAVEAERMLQIIELLRERFDLPVWAKPQAKLSDKCATGRSTETPEKFARHARALVDAGASAVGGCCGTTPASIAALRAALDREPAKVAS